MDELLASVRRLLDDRLSNPLTSSFFISWSAWNYKFFVILFSDNSVTTTFRLIDEICFPTGADYLLQGFSWPLLSALAYIYLYPFPARWVYSHWLKIQRGYMETKYKIEDAQLLSVEEAREIRMQNRSLAQKIKAKDEEIHTMETDFRAELARMSLKSESESVTVGDEPVVIVSPAEKPALSSDELAVLKLFSSGNRELNADGIANFLNVPISVARYGAQQLVDRRFLWRDPRGIYSLADEGTKYLLNRHMFDYQKKVDAK